MTRDIKTLLTKGKNNPGRKELPLIVDMFRFPEECIEELMTVQQTLSGQNDLYKEYYGLSQTIKIAQQVAYSTPGYAQHLLQTPSDDGFQTEKNYTIWNDFAPRTRDFMESSWPGCFRSRIAILQPNTCIPWHIDDDTKISLRFHVNLNQGHTKFWFKVKNEEVFFELEPFKAYFLNVGYPHKVENLMEFERVNFLWGCEWPVARPYLEKYLLNQKNS